MAGFLTRFESLSTVLTVPFWLVPVLRLFLHGQQSRGILSVCSRVLVRTRLPSEEAREEGLLQSGLARVSGDPVVFMVFIRRCGGPQLGRGEF